MVRPKKRRPLILDRTPEARFRARAGRETPALERPHLSARRGGASDVIACSAYHTTGVAPWSISVVSPAKVLALY